MSTSDTYLVSKTSNGTTDLKNIFQVNPNCNSTNITLPFQTTGPCFIEYSSGYYIIKWSDNGSFTNLSITSNIDVLIVGGGGSGGGGGTANPYTSSGGNGGSVTHVNFLPANSNVTYFIGVGQGGNSVGASVNGYTGNNGGISNFNANDSSVLITVPGGNGGYTGSYWPYGQGACSITLPGGSIIYQTPLNTITGGNGNMISSGSNAYSCSGNNGYGVFIPTNSSNLHYFGGGGGCSGAYVGGNFVSINAGNGGLGGGGNGGYLYGVSPYPFVSVGNGINGTGGGGGGGADGYYDSAAYNSGRGGNGTVIIWFKYPN